MNEDVERDAVWRERSVTDERALEIGWRDRSVRLAQNRRKRKTTFREIPLQRGKKLLPAATIRRQDLDISDLQLSASFH